MKNLKINVLIGTVFAIIGIIGYLVTSTLVGFLTKSYMAALNKESTSKVQTSEQYCECCCKTN